MISCLHTILIAFVTLSLLAQSPPKRKKIKAFGSSLKRLKWNPEKNTAIELPTVRPTSNAEEDDVIRIDTSLVSSDLLVLDQHGQTVAGLTADDFIIAEDGAPQTVTHFSTGDNVNVPRTIVLLIDYSGSQVPYLYNSIKAAKVLVDKLGPRDVMAIVTDDVQLIQDFTNDKRELKEKLDSVLYTINPTPRVIESGGRSPSLGTPFPRFGRSKQYTALMATLNELFQKADVRRIIIFQTDGDEALYLRNPKVVLTIPPGLTGATLQAAQEKLLLHQRLFPSNETQFSLEDLYRVVERERATLYTVIPGARYWGLPLEDQIRKWNPAQLAQAAGWMGHLSSKKREELRNQIEKENQHIDPIVVETNVDLISKEQAILASIASVSGGWSDYLEMPEQADAIYSRIFSDINQRYLVGYYPSNKERDGKRRNIEFKVKGHPEYKVYGRLSYFAPSP
ncbi:MAG TPA: VWA domain-containing protein [Pyrinomonadaceae bacterium]|nr:VWA domain-containing protein [Pyrinomonadaceae bacterium]